MSFLIKHKNNKSKFLNILASADQNEINSITELIYNFIKGNLKCRNPLKFKSHAKVLRIIADPNKGFRIRRRKTVQGAGILIPLLASVVPLVLQMINRKKVK